MDLILEIQMDIGDNELDLYYRNIVKNVMEVLFLLYFFF